MPLPPLRFIPLLKARAWGGDRLRGLGKDVGDATAIGESWEVADLGPPVADGVSKVASGPFRGASLSDLLGAHGTAMLGRSRAVDGRFPLLVKFLDAREHLSVQVHPTGAYAAKHPGSHLKTEAWLVVTAAPGAAVFRGIHEGIAPERFRQAIEDGSAVECLIREEVRPGDCIPLESGLCHALGAGVVVAEVQTPSDTTFRVFDWDRRDPERPLHVDQAMECILFGEAQGLGGAPIRNIDRCEAPWSDGLRAATLCANRHFDVEVLEASPSGDAAPIAVEPAGLARVLVVLSGEAILETAGHVRESLRAGDTVLLPADVARGELQLAPGSLAMRSTVQPPPDRDSRRQGPGRVA